MDKKIYLALMAMLTVLPGFTQCGARETDAPVGIVKTLSGQVWIQRGEQRMPAALEMPLMTGDALETGGDAGVGIIFKDNSPLSLGPDSKFIIREFIFEPTKEKFTLIGSVVRGTLTYLSGLINKLKPESVEFRTPSAAISVRGTHLAIEVKEDS
ncbi:FecR domain-containing protein [uncultured Desulfobacter sp.]|uniref:FecR family protein n=1 Tax=uncultured Desulfobacter sp. TaxID=240139 RepID=UPI002AA6C254|nr:FecR domain-containing protein [uncultured Desulfobacter sp.]